MKVDGLIMDGMSASLTSDTAETTKGGATRRSGNNSRNSSSDMRSDLFCYHGRAVGNSERIRGDGELGLTLLPTITRGIDLSNASNPVPLLSTHCQSRVGRRIRQYVYKTTG